MGGWRPPERREKVGGLGKSPGATQEETGGLRLCLAQSVCACRDGDPCPEREAGWWYRGGFPAPKAPLSPVQVWGVPRGFLLHVHSCSWCLAGVRVLPPLLPGFCPSSVCLSVCLSVPIPHPPRRAWGSLRVCGTGPLPRPSPVFISHCTTGTAMPNKTAMGSSCVAVFGAAVRGGMLGVMVGITMGSEVPQRSSPSTARAALCPHTKAPPRTERTPQAMRAALQRHEQRLPG